jgi:hypothetical protein
MIWTRLNFGKHIGKTLPQVVLSDPNWFFWAVGTDIFTGKLRRESTALDRCARSIRIPKRNPRNWEVEYRWDREQRFLGFDFVKVERGFHHLLFSYLPHLDLAYVRQGNIHDIRDCRLLIDDFRRLYFGGLNLTKQRCGEFFENEENFTGAGGQS